MCFCPGCEPSADLPLSCTNDTQKNRIRARRRPQDVSKLNRAKFQHVERAALGVSLRARQASASGSTTQPGVSVLSSREYIMLGVAGVALWATRRLKR